MAALNPHISGHTLRPQAIERFGRYILSNTARVPVNHPSRIFGAPRGGGFVENPIRILTNSCDDNPSPGEAADGWVAPALSDTSGCCWEHGWESKPQCCQGLGLCLRLPDRERSAAAWKLRALWRRARADIGASPKGIPATGDPVRGAGARAGRAAEDPSEFLRPALQRTAPGAMRRVHLCQPVRKGSTPERPPGACLRCRGGRSAPGSGLARTPAR